MMVDLEVLAAAVHMASSDARGTKLDAHGDEQWCRRQAASLVEHLRTAGLTIALLDQPASKPDDAGGIDVERLAESFKALTYSQGGLLAHAVGEAGDWTEADPDTGAVLSAREWRLQAARIVAAEYVRLTNPEDRPR